MICQECNKRPATLHFTKIVNGEKTEVHICEKCAQEKGEMFMFNGGGSFSINNLLAGLLNMEPVFQHTNPSTIAKSQEAQCPGCNMTFSEFTQAGKFGCAQCYETFKDNLNPVLKRLHSGNTAHIGKIPERLGGGIHLRKKMDDLKQLLKDAIDQEEFEKAAELRDELRSLEKSIKEGHEGGNHS
ncbi:hypothetical protein D0469_11915 [Peribacillus saganii]|uniref:UVR domain-containing protein n=2 Tax=Peribacillus saganii TaxID=2303992 RepID=A0A372LMT1_9BACI|nr:hypothetical protein D0469_11915 [Peribacillus saganii]